MITEQNVACDMNTYNVKLSDMVKVFLNWGALLDGFVLADNAQAFVFSFAILTLNNGNISIIDTDLFNLI